MTNATRSCLLLVAFAAVAVASEPIDSARIVIQPRSGEPATVRLPQRDGMTRVIVELAPGATAAEVQSDFAALARNTIRSHAGALVVDHEYSVTIRGAALSLPSESLPVLYALRSLRAVHADRVVHALGEPGVAAIRAPEVWDRLGARGAGTTIAIIDTGVDYLHPALGGGFGPSYKVRGGYDFVDGDDDPMDENGHGTHVAGIAAANSVELAGVAPEAALLAFRVLDEWGSGSTSAVLAAIERAVDPNGDGDPADHADVINLSLGGPGGPGDVLSRAVDAAVANGVVVCAAAGNDGLVHSIGSPGSAEHAITAGASIDDDEIAQSSSRGPNLVSYSIKPDLIAPGVGVRSAARGGGLATMSGTSMATPHVSGAAALLLQLHPDWTPSMVKSALVNGARGYPLPVMEAGSGRVDAWRGANASLFVSPSSVSFDRTDGTAPLHTGTRTLTLSNRSAVARDITLDAPAGTAGVTLVVAPSSLSIPAGESRTVELTLTADNAIVPFVKSFSFGGVVEIRSAEEVWRVPWAFVKGIRVRIEPWTPLAAATITAPGGALSDVPLAGDALHETLVRPGTVDVTLAAQVGDAIAFAVFENESLRGDRELVFPAAEAMHRMEFTGYDETGAPLDSLVGVRCLSHRTLLFPATSGLELLRAYGEAGPLPVLTSTLSERFAVNGGTACASADALRLHVLHYDSLRGVDGDLKRTAGGPALQGREVSLLFPPFARGARTLALGGAADTLESRQTFVVAGVSWPDAVWNGTVFLEEIHDADAGTHPYLVAAVFDGVTQAVTEPGPLRIEGTTATSYRSAATTPVAQQWPHGERMVFGAGFSMPRPFYWSWGRRGLADVRYEGLVGETRTPSPPAQLTLIDEAGNRIASMAGGMILDDVTRRMELHIESDDYVVEGIRGRSRVVARFGGGAGDGIPPSVTWLNVRDSRGAPATRLEHGAPASILLAAVDYEPEIVPSRIGEGSVAVFFRRRGSSAWQPLPLVRRGEDFGTNSELRRDPFGTIYEAALATVTSGPAGIYDLRITVDDRKGNSSETTLEPAFVVSGPGRRRAVRR